MLPLKLHEPVIKKGFAVVAGEVRTLSQRSSSAAKDIENLIKDSVQKIEVGSKLVNSSGTTLEEIQQAISITVNVIEEVFLSVSDQSDGIARINVAMMQMKESTHQNEGMVKRTSELCQDLASESNNVDQLIGFSGSKDVHKMKAKYGQ